MHLKRLARTLPIEYNFFPESWTLPTESYQLKDYAAENPNLIYIVKPEGGSQGRGIYLTRKLDGTSFMKKMVIQRYL